MPVPSPPQPRANSPPSMVSTSVSLEAIQPTLSLQLYCLFTLHCTLWILLSLVSSFSTTGVIIINELFLHDSTDDNNLKLDQLVLHQGGKFTSLSTRKHYYSLEIQVYVRQYSVDGPSEILASHWSSQIDFDQWF